MRGLLLALLLVAPFLSGCLMLQPEPEPAPEAPVAGIDLLPLPEVRAQTGAQGFWVPEGAERLVLRWNGSAAVNVSEGQKARDVHEERPNGVLSYFDDLLLVVGPNGTRLHVGTPSLRLHTDASVGPSTADNTTSHRSPPGVFLDIPSPTPGLYRLVTFGDIPLPQVALHGAQAAGLILTPLPVTVTRTTLTPQIGPLAAPLDGKGTLPLHPGTVAVWGGLSGTGADVRLDLQNEDGARVAHIRQVALAEPGTAGIGQFTLGFTRIFEEWTSDPTLLHTPTIHWTLEGTGTGVAFAYAAVVGDLPPSTAQAVGGNDTVPLEGRLAPREAGGVVLPAGADLIVHRASSSEARDHVSFRIYDAEGARIHTGATADTTQRLSLPPGPIAILNDGPGDLEVAIAGALPSDAVLHPLEGITKTYNIQLGEPAGGPAETSLRATLDGPLTMLYYNSFGTLDEIYVQLHRDDDTPVLSIPDLAAYYPGTPACCTIYGYGSKGADAPWVDPGIHRVHLRSEAGEGQISLSARYIDLSALLTLGASEEQDGN